MREPPNWILRIAVPLALVGAGVFGLFAVLRNTQNAGAPPTPAPASTPAGSQTPAATPDPAAQPSPSADAGKPQTPPVADKPEASAAPPAARPAARYIVRKHPATPYSPLGSTRPKSDASAAPGYQMEITFAPFGAGVEQLVLANHRERVLSPEPKVLQQFVGVLGSGDPRIGLAAFAAKGLTIDGVQVGLGVDPTDQQSVLWKQVEAGTFEATIAEGEAGNETDILRITRRYILEPSTYQVRLEQRIENLTDRPISVIWHQLGPADQPPETVRYGGDPRAIRFGYMYPPARDPAQIVQSDASSASTITHNDALGSPDGSAYPPRTFWPNRAGQRDGLTLAWAAMTSRYFTVAVHPAFSQPPPVPTTPGQRTLPVASIERVAVPTTRPATLSSSAGGPFGAIALELVWPQTTIAPRAAADVSLGIYAGPTSKRIISSNSAANAAGLVSAVIYTFGGPCGFCTFQTLTSLLSSFLQLLHDFVLFDWALAIIALVVCVRTILHPVTRWSQIKMLRSGKIMGKLAPKQKAIQEKYASDPDMMRREVARLMQEEGMGAGAGMAMGCIPAFLQMPVWLALSATLYFLFELRHQGAFFDLFQSISGGKWSFFADLAEPDHFLAFGREFHIPLLSGLMGPIDGLNIMPLLMGVVFYVQQKYLSPPTAATMTPEQEQQMKIMRVMTVVMFPFFMYNAPSGLALYFFTNSSLGIIESKWIRSKAEPIIDAEIEELERKRAAGKSKRDDPARKPGFFERVQKLAEERQRMMEEARKAQARKDKGKR